MAQIHREIVIVGGGFGGYYAARELTRRKIPVTLIDSSGYQTFQPLLYQAATGLIDPDNLDFDLADIELVSSIPQTVTSIDLENQVVTLADGQQVVSDYLVLATGAAVNFFGTPGAADHSFPLYTGADAKAIKAKLREIGMNRSDDIKVVVVGGGATGVEITGAILDVFTRVLPRTFPDSGEWTVDLHIVDLGDALLASMSEEGQDFAAETLTKAGVTLHLGKRVVEVTEDGVNLEDGTSLPSHITIWAGGLTPNAPELQPAPEQGHGGRFVVQPNMTLPNYENIYCVGDMAIVPDDVLPQLGSVAKQQGLFVGKSIKQQRDGKESAEFSYRDMGDMAMVRCRAAVVEIGRNHHVVTGIAAFTMRLGLHAYLLPGDRNRFETVRNWLHTLSTGKSAAID